MGKVVEGVLKILQAGAEGTVTLMDAVLVGSAASPRPYYRMKYEPIRFKTNWAESYRRRQSFYSLLNKLKREGLVKKTRLGGETSWGITRKGREHLIRIWMRGSRTKKEILREPLVSRKKYTTKPSKELIVVSFDVPEYARRRRRWLRACLISFGFSRLHKSVWMGNYGLPKEFIDDLKDLKMLPWIHMFVAARHGTIVEDVSQERKRPGVH